MIPKQLVDEPLIRLRHQSKRPVIDAYAVEPIDEIRNWIDSDGNVGVSLQDDLVVLDVDHPRFGRFIDDHLPFTFTVRTGSGFDHRYYRCPGWTECKQITKNGDDFGSIRSDGWQVAAPPSVHPNGERYTVKSDIPIGDVDPSDLRSLVDDLSDRPWYDSRRQHERGGGRGGDGAPRPAGVGGDRSTPDGYPDRTASWSTCKKWLDANGFLGELSWSSSPDWSGREFKLAKCLAEGGFSRTSIRQALSRIHPNAKWHRGSDELTVEEYQRLTVRKAIEAAVADPYVSFSDDGDRSRAPKPEEQEKRENAPAWWLKRRKSGGE